MTNIIEVKDISIVFIVLFLTVLILIAIFLTLTLILYCIRKKVVIRRNPKVAPALIAAVMGKVSS